MFCAKSQLKNRFEALLFFEGLWNMIDANIAAQAEVLFLNHSSETSAKIFRTVTWTLKIRCALWSWTRLWLLVKASPN
ncbi:Hypothetical predicted protein [Cloeon dipterum]|uniref:Uncharacterized protein n=1 Tax=Cloeon dipterum TaxID=197152 RepID=A0A8S1CLB9_9INSE|nr:Hypothetical predicted protein [Cloeon dipterum]